MASPKQVLALLQKVWLFEGLEPSVLAPLAASANSRKVPAGQIVVEVGGTELDLYVIVSGHFKVWVPTNDKGVVVLNVIGPGEVFGELSLLDGAPRSATVQALVRGEVLVLRRTEVLDLLRRSPETSMRLLQKLTALVRLLSNRAEEHATLSIGERLARRLLDLSARCGVPISRNQIALTIRLPQRELGELIQGTRESVNKWLSRWENEGIVYKTRSQIVIRDRARLEAQIQRPLV